MVSREDLIWAVVYGAAHGAPVTAGDSRRLQTMAYSREGEARKRADAAVLAYREAEAQFPHDPRQDEM